jgi:type II secretory pathway component GspD/PulD (secretin)
VIRVFFFFLVLFSYVVHAQENLISFRFRDVRVSDLIQVIYSDIFNRSYVLDNSITHSTDTITLDLSRITSAQFDYQLRFLLDDMGYKVTDSNGILFFSKRREGENNLVSFVYRPVYRSVSYLTDLSGIFFNRDSFSVQRGVKLPDGAVFNSGMDTRTNAFSMIDKNDADVIVFNGTLQEIDKLKKLLSDLDKPIGEVVVKAVVYEVRNDLTKSNAISLAVGLLKSVNGVGVRISSNPDSENSIKITTPNLQSVWSAFSGDSRFKLVSSPTIRVKSGGKARFMAGQEVPTLGSVTYPSMGQSVQSIDYKSSGVILELTPEIRGSIVELDINQQISDFTSTSTGVNSSPTLLKRELKTSVIAGDDEIIILGGLERTSDSNVKEGLFFLPDFLRSRNDEKEQTEILMLLHVQRI